MQTITNLKHLALIFISLFCFNALFSQKQYTVQGTVFAANGIIAKGAQVTGQSYKTETDAAGNFILLNVNEGNLQLTLFLEGYKNYSKKIK